MLLAVGTANAASPPPTGLPTDASAFQGKLIGADAGWKLQFANGDARRAQNAAQLVTWGEFVDPNRGAQILLAEGGSIVVDAKVDPLRLTQDNLLARSRLLGEIKLPLEFVAAALLRPPRDRVLQDALAARARNATGQDDRLMLENGDELTGTLLALDDRKATFQTGDLRTELPVDQIAAIVFNPKLRSTKRPRGLAAWVGLSDGSRLLATSLLGDASNMRLELAGGATFKMATSSIRGIQPIGGDTVYLSDLQPTSYRHLPYLELSWPLGVDHSVGGAPLRHGGKPFLKGLGMHSPARVTYDLNGDFRRFEAEVAVDDEAAEKGSVVFRVFTDHGDGQWREQAASQVLRGQQPSAPISVDLTGAKRISLLVDFADRGDELDHADWLNARLIK